MVEEIHLPVVLYPADEAAWTALGFTLGPQVEDEPRLRHATLPEGWTRQASAGEPRCTDILDTRGIPRAVILDEPQKARASIFDAARVLTQRAIYDGVPIPWDLLTDDEQAAARRELADYLENTAVRGELLARVQELHGSAPAT